MSNNQCCYVSQNTLLTQCVFKVSAFGFSACTKTCAPLSDCCINNALIHFIPSCQDTCTQFVNKFVDKFSTVSHSIISGLTMPSCSHKCGLATTIFHFS